VIRTACFVATCSLVWGCCAATLPPSSVPPGLINPVPNSAGARTLEWSVINRFRLVELDGAGSAKQKAENDRFLHRYARELNMRLPKEGRLAADATSSDILFARFLETYYDLGEPLVAWNLLDTWWNGARYEQGYVGGPSYWDVRMRADIPGECRWTVEGVAETKLDACRNHVIRRIQGSTKITATSSLGNPTLEVQVSPRDVLIVSLGDSYSSGEGVPDLGRHWKRAAKWMDERCHRSLFSAPSLAAMMYARINEHVSVTHVSFACSGASLNAPDAKNGGILTPYDGAVPIPHVPPLVPQVDALREALTVDGVRRKPRFLTLGIGGNDLGFGDVVRDAILKSPDEMRKTIEKAKSISSRLQTGINDLEQQLEQEQTSYKEGIDVIVPGYPNPASLWRLPLEAVAGIDEAHLQKALEESCGVKGNGTLSLTGPYFSIEKEKIDIIEKEFVGRFVQPFVAQLRSGLHARTPSPEDDKRWSDSFRFHGYCGAGLSNDAPTRWVNTLRDSYELLSTIPGGGSVGALLTNVFDKEGGMGTMHPNIRGQTATALWILEQMVAAECPQPAPGDPMCDDRRPWLAKVPGER
jgi:hypothetical protein